MTLLIITACLALFIAGLCAMHGYVDARYNYNVFSIINFALSFACTVGGIFAACKLQQGQMPGAIISTMAAATGCAFMVVRDAKHTSIVIALIALTLRLALSVILILILIWSFYMKKSPREERH